MSAERDDESGIPVSEGDELQLVWGATKSPRM